MLLHEENLVSRPIKEDANGRMDDPDESIPSPDISPRECADDDNGNDNLKINDNDSTVLGADDLPGDVSDTKSLRGKKRVQFLPDGYLVRIRVIPPRSNKSSSDSDGSASDSSDSEDSDTETVTDSEENLSSDRDTPSPAVPTESKNKFATMPPLVYAAKGSYAVSKQNNNNNKPGLLVAKITGINRPVSPSNANAKAKKGKRVGSPKFDNNKNQKKNVKTNEKVNDNIKRNSEENKIKGRRKRVPLKFKEGKISPPPSSKSNKSATNQKMPVKLSQRRNSNTPMLTKTAPPKRSHLSTTTLTTSVKPLSSSSPSASPGPEMSLDRVSRAMQSVSMGKLYTIDGFIFPPHHAKELHLPDLTIVSKSTDDFSRDSSSNGNNNNNNNSTLSPRRSYQGNVVHQQQYYPNANQNNVPQQQISPSSANRRRRYYAWQMANGSIQNTLTNTPNISQLWDNIAVQSDTLDTHSTNVHKHM